MFEAGETTATIVFKTDPDTQAEDDDSFTVELSTIAVTNSDLQSSVVHGTRKATATIVDDDDLRVTVEGSDRVAEGDDATYRFRLNGDKTGSQTVTVEYTTNGDDSQTEQTIAATESTSADFTVGTGSLTVGQTLSVEITDVSTTEGTVTVGSPSEKRTPILHEDTVTVGITAPNGGTVEENVGNASFSVTQQGDLSLGATLTVTYQVVAGSASTADFTRPSTTTLNLSESTNIVVPIVNDLVAEGAETFSVRLTDADSSNSADRVVRGDDDGTVDDLEKRRADGEGEQTGYERAGR